MNYTFLIIFHNFVDNFFVENSVPLDNEVCDRNSRYKLNSAALLEPDLGRKQRPVVHRLGLSVVGMISFVVDYDDSLEN